MNASLMSLEIVVVLLGLGLLLVDLWMPPEHKRKLGYVAALALLVVFGLTFRIDTGETQHAAGGMYVLDAFALYFKRFFLVAAVLVLVMAAEFSDRVESGA